MSMTGFVLAGFVLAACWLTHDSVDADKTSKDFRDLKTIGFVWSLGRNGPHACRLLLSS